MHIRWSESMLRRVLLRSLRTNAVKESFDLEKREVLTRPIERGYPQDLVEKILAELQFSSRNTALKKRTENNWKYFAVLYDFQFPQLLLTGRSGL